MEFQNKLFQKFKIDDNDIEQIQKEFYLQSQFRIKSEQKLLDYYTGIIPSFFKKNKNILQRNEDIINNTNFNSTLIKKGLTQCLNEKFYFNKMSNKRIFTDEQKLSKKLIKQNQEQHIVYYYLGGLFIVSLGLAMTKRYRKLSVILIMPQIIQFSWSFNYIQNIQNLDQYFYSIPELPDKEWEKEKMNIYSQCLHYSKEPLLKLLNNQS